MCLDTIDRKPEQVTEGWKVFRVIDNTIYGSKRKHEFKYKKWNKDILNNLFIDYDDEHIYQTGFHFYFNEEDAKKEAYAWNSTIGALICDPYNVKIYTKIKVKNIVATGFQNKCRVGVAEEIFIGGKVCI